MIAASSVSIIIIIVNMGADEDFGNERNGGQTATFTYKKGLKV